MSYFLHNILYVIPFPLFSNCNLFPNFLFPNFFSRFEFNFGYFDNFFKAQDVAKQPLIGMISRREEPEVEADVEAEAILKIYRNLKVRPVYNICR